MKERTKKEDENEKKMFLYILFMNISSRRDKAIIHFRESNLFDLCLEI